MGRHSKNAGTMGAEALTYHERRALGYGTVKERLGKVRVGRAVVATDGRACQSFRLLSLTLTPAPSHTHTRTHRTRLATTLTAA